MAQGKYALSHFLYRKSSRAGKLFQARGLAHTVTTEQANGFSAFDL
jgi:hypothetical protein